MISFKNMRLAPKIALPVSVMLIVCLGSLAWIIQDRSADVIRAIAHKELSALAGRYGADVQGFIEISLNESTSLASILQDVVQDQTSMTREEVINVFRSSVKKNTLFVGAGCVWLPNAFDGKDAEYATQEPYKPDGKFSLYVAKSGGSLSVTSLSEEGEYYQGPKRTGKPYVTDPYDYDINGQKVSMVTGAVPIKLNGRFIGTVCTDISVETMTEKLNNIHVYGTGTAFLLNQEGQIITHPNSSRINVNLFQDPQIKIANPGALKQAMRQGKPYNDIRIIDGKKMLCYYQPITFRNTGISWYVLVTAPMDRVLASATSLSWLSVSLCLGVLALVLLIVVLVTRFTARPIVQLAALAQEVASGNYQAKIDSPIWDDEVGQLRISLRKMIASLLQSLSEAETLKKDAERQAANAREAMIKAEAAGQEAHVKSQAMLKAADKLEEVAGIVSSASAELSAQIEQSEHGASEQADRVTETMTAMEEMTSTVEEVARNAGKASDISLQTREQAAEGAKIVNNAVASIQQVQQKSLALREDMTALSEHAQSITQIMGVISDIADQTNLLALNAAIEAARAGEAGRGFAVVADEVRKLAEKTMASTTDVGNAIKAIQESARKSMEQVDRAVLAIDEATGLANQSGEALNRIVDMADSTADQVRIIATASEQQAASSEEISKSINQVNSIAGETVNAMGEAARAVSDLAGQAQSLSTLIDDMKRR